MLSPFLSTTRSLRGRLTSSASARALELRVLLATTRPRRHGDPLLGAAVLLADGHVLAHVDQTAGEVARVGGAQGGVGEALAGAVGGDEELEHREALDEARLHRLLDDLALRIGHLAAPAGELADLLDVAAGARGRHHVDRVERLEVGLGGRRDLHVGLAPDLLDLAAPLLLGEEAHCCTRSWTSARPSSRASARISAFSFSGMTTSFLETVTAARVA